MTGLSSDPLASRQDTLLEFIESIGGEPDLPPLLTRILRLACELIGADHGAIGLVDEKANVVRTEAIYNMPANELGSIMPPGVGIAGTVLLTHEPIVLDRYGDVSTPLRPDALENPVIGMPIMWRGRMIGFFGIGVYADAALREGRELRRFEHKDLDVLGVFARHAAIAIQNARRSREERQRTERFALVARIGHIVAANLDLRDVLQRAADAIHELLGYQNVAIPLIRPENPGVLVLNTVGGAYKDIVKDEYYLPISSGIMGAAARTGKVVLVNDVANDPRHIRTPGAEYIKAELAVPIRLGARVLGVLNVESADTFDEQDAASLEIVADQLAVAIENARLYERGQQLAALEERHRLARDLHDSVTQHIFGLNLIAQTLGSAWRRDAAEGERRIARLLELSRTALAELRELLAELRPVADVPDAESEALLTGSTLIRHDGLAEALRRHVQRLADDGPVIELDAQRYQPQPLATEETLFRIAQEALNNVIKHAQAGLVRVKLEVGADAAAVVIQDDGVGFQPDAVEGGSTTGGLGLLIMQERAQALGGDCTVRSAPGQGTRVLARVPAQARAAP